MTRNSGDLLRRITRLHTALQQRTATCCGIQSLTRCQMLTTLGRESPLTLADLSRRLGADKGWLSRNVDELVQDGLVSKQPRATDRRAIELTLTAQGQEQVAALNAELAAQSVRLLGHVPQEEQAGVLRALELLAAALEAESQKSQACVAT
ncbi:MarR family winged helix-turn-helix transcriptional regulator [Deinococcus aquatilis]|uniref:MarR family winged helix-turn-helix transcriptional regulator n=1 Tax=Deinococcus aquatilis TaxID=519440 RepID=UPI00036CBAC6|nr:MarR family transcriptional regulator [Deinococcus aquatilis]